MDIPHPFIKTIEWDMMDKKKFFPLSMLSSFSVRCCLYPLTVIKTRLQLQKHGEMYGGTIDAFKKIYAFEGVAGLYRGFWISSVQIVSGVFYISTYEGIRHMMAQKNIDGRVRALVGGGCASVVSQTIVVPFDIISQHLMVLGLVQNEKNVKISPNELVITVQGKSWFNITREIVAQIYLKDGVQGFYRGYLASLAAYVPNSAMWWAFYHLYQDEIIKISPVWISHLFVQCIAGTLGGFTTTLLTNPLDIIRARLQSYKLTYSVKRGTLPVSRKSIDWPEMLEKLYVDLDFLLEYFLRRIFNFCSAFMDFLRPLFQINTVENVLKTKEVLKNFEYLKISRGAITQHKKLIY